MSEYQDTYQNQDTDEILRSACARLLTDCCTAQVREQSASGVWAGALWDALSDAGLVSAIEPRSEGGGLLDWETLATLIQLSGEFATPLPWVETLLAQRHFAMAGLEFPDGPLSIAPSVPAVPYPVLSRSPSGWLLDGHLSRVGWGRDANAIAVVARHQQGYALVRIDKGHCSGLFHNEAQDPRDRFVFSGAAVASDCVSLDYVPANSLLAEGALARSLLMVGAMSKVLDLTLQYSLDRVQFGKPISKFQAVQHLVAVQASHTAAATAAVMAAVFAAQQGPAAFEIAAAKTRASEAAGLAARTAHQVHGAMGITKEYPLHFWTRRLFAWRDEFGNETQWANALGKISLEAGGQGLWPLVCNAQQHSEKILQMMEVGAA